MNLEKEAQEVLSKIAREKIVRECDLSGNAGIIEFRKKVQPLIVGGIVHSEIRQNPNDLFEEEFHYSLTEYGEEYYRSLNPIH
ncbi:Uncharacterised protein [uncultured archaeon]|nr:Uncharacterised protein [uncultured archaeon]